MTNGGRRETDSTHRIDVQVGYIQILVKGKKAVRSVVLLVVSFVGHVAYTQYEVWSLRVQVAECQSRVNKLQTEMYDFSPMPGGSNGQYPTGPPPVKDIQ